MRAVAACAVLGLLTGAAPAGAAALTVSPILLDMGTTAPDALLTIQNRDAHAVMAQVRVFRWTQDGTGDQLAPTDAVEASPPIVQIGPRGSYAVRLHRGAGADAPGEAAYRVVVDELPDLNRQRNGAINVLLRYSIPLFVGAPDASQPDLRWRVTGGPGGPVLSATNEGDKRLQVRALRVAAGGRATSVAPGLAGYVLGHSTRAWALPRTVGPGAGLRVVAGSDRGPLDVALRP